MAKKRRHEQHVRIYAHELQCAAWRSLSCEARALLVEARALYKGQENRIHLSLRQTQERLGVGRRKAEKARDELLDRGFLRVLRPGAFSRKDHRATEFILTNEPLQPHRDGATAPKDFMRWRPPDQETVYTTYTNGAHHVHRDPAPRPPKPPDGVRHVHRGAGEGGGDGVRSEHTDKLPGGFEARAPCGTLPCSCGGQTTQQRKTRCGMELLWQQCGSCGRCGGWRLRADRRMVAHGEVARRAFWDETLLAQAGGT